jgi:general secretion pathway protein H
MPRRARGFTLIELMVVMALVAIASSVAALALRDPSATRLEREASRLASILEAARAEARASGLETEWIPSDKGEGFSFVGLPESAALPSDWLEPGVFAEIRTPRGRASALVLGPEPVIGPQRIVLRLEDRQLVLATDGLGPFVLAAEEAPPDAPR